VCAPATEDLCREELARAGARKPLALTEGVLVVPHGTETAGLAFSRQVLPRARFVQAESASALADAVARALDDDDERDWLSGALVVDVSLPDVLKTRARSAGGLALPASHPLEEGVAHIRDVLALKRAGRARKKDVAPAAAGAAARRVELLVTDAWSGALSSSHARDDDALSAWPVAFPAGRAPVDDDPNAPSTAHRKLDEALLWLGVAPREGEVVLDLGAAPGGWTHVALRHGARVVAVDRGFLDARVLASGRVTHVRRDAFAVAVAGDIEGDVEARGLVDDADWLVCDIIVEPERTLALLARALASPRLRAFVVTLKLRRPVDFTVVERARELLASDARFRARAVCLASNKVEITLLGRAR